MTERHDPLDNIEHPTLSERIQPYQRYGDDELAMALLRFADAYGAGIPSPANHGPDYYCENCEMNVRGVGRCSRRDCEDRAVVEGEAHHPRYGTFRVKACLRHSGEIAVTGYVSNDTASTEMSRDGGEQR